MTVEEKDKNEERKGEEIESGVNGREDGGREFRKGQADVHGKKGGREGGEREKSETTGK